MLLGGLALVLASAALHASWNFLVKRSGASGAAFTWLFTMPTAIVLAPFAIAIARDDALVPTADGVLWLLGSALIHTVYFLALQRGYLAGDLSVVYPLARGSGPLIASLAAVAFLHERPSLTASAGALAIIGGTVALAVQRVPRSAARGGGMARPSGTSVAYGLGIGALIGAYTVWDTFLVTALRVSPIVLEWLLSVSIALIVTPAVLRDRSRLVEAWRRHLGTALAGAALSSASYILFLFALRILPVTRAAPLREVSVLLGAALGARLLAEGTLRQRLGAAAVITVGIVLLSVG